jgi:hypothetical protein
VLQQVLHRDSGLSVGKNGAGYLILKPLERQLVDSIRERHTTDLTNEFGSVL